MKQQKEPQPNQGKQESPDLSGVIGKQVMHTLGQPGGLLQVQVRHLWENHYRLNVLVGADASSAKVAHSYFLEADSVGNILTSNPVITKRY